jgi:ATP synthase protein I
MKMSLDLFSSILVGMMIGLGIDNFFSTKPVFLLIFLVLGIIAGFYSLYKSAQNLNKKD